MSTKFLPAMLASALICVPACGDKDKDKDKAPEVAAADQAAAPKKAAEPTPPAPEPKKPEPEPVKPAAGASLEWLQYLPAEAELVAQFSMKNLTSSSLWKENRETLEQDPETKRKVEALKSCQLDVETFDSISVAQGQENLAVVLAGPGISEMKNLHCVHDVLAQDGHGDEWKIEKRDGEEVIVVTMPDMPESMVGRVVEGKALVFASPAWQEPTKKLIAGSAASVKDGPLKDVLARADSSKMLWLAANIPTDERNQMEPPFASLADITASLDFTKGLGLNVSARVGKPEEAAAIKSQIEAMFAQYKGFALMAGVPERLVNKVTFSTQDATVVMNLALDDAELKELQDRLKAMLSGMDPNATGGGEVAAAGTQPGTGATKPDASANSGTKKSDGSSKESDSSSKKSDSSNKKSDGDANKDADSNKNDAADPGKDAGDDSGKKQVVPKKPDGTKSAKVKFSGGLKTDG